MWRFQYSEGTSSAGSLYGMYGKISTVSANGKIGIKSDDFGVYLKGVGDALIVKGKAGLQLNEGLGLALNAKAAVASGRATILMELSGWEVEVGVSGDFAAVGAQIVVGLFPEQGYVVKANVALGAGGGSLVRVKPPQP